MYNLYRSSHEACARKWCSLRERGTFAEIKIWPTLFILIAEDLANEGADVEELDRVQIQISMVYDFSQMLEKVCMLATFERGISELALGHGASLQEFKVSRGYFLLLPLASNLCLDIGRFATYIRDFFRQPMEATLLLLRAHLRKAYRLFAPSNLAFLFCNLFPTIIGAFYIH